ncbi:MAG: hypothetical protein IT204_14110 [Fimbriimonadaceae bacterium]|nr:hypothetical protein [Fimbriimonadaceae bacterium]
MGPRRVLLGVCLTLVLGRAGLGATPTARELADLLTARGERLSAICFNYGTIERSFEQGQVLVALENLKATSGFYGFDRATGTERFTRCGSAPKQPPGGVFEYEAGYQDQQRSESASILVADGRPLMVNTTKSPTSRVLHGSHLVAWWFLNEVVPEQLRRNRWSVLRVEEVPERAVVIGAGPTEFWLAPDLGYALTRSRAVGPRGENGSMVVFETRYGKHQEVGGMHMPTTYLLSQAIILADKGQVPTFVGLTSEYGKVTDLHCNAAAIDAMQSQRQVPWLFGGTVWDPGQPQLNGQSMGHNLHGLLAEGLREAPFGLTEPTREELLEYGKRALAAIAK